MEIKIGPYTFGAEIVPIAEVDPEGKGNLGHWMLSELAIKIREGMPVELIRETFWHELVHIVSDQHNVKLDEDQVDALAIGLIELLDDNPGIVEVFK